MADATLMRDPDTGDLRAMSPGVPSGAFVGLARAATRRNSESWLFETAREVGSSAFSADSPTTCRQPADCGMLTVRERVRRRTAAVLAEGE